MARHEHNSVHTLASLIVQRGLTVPAIVLLELAKPLSFLCSQALLMIDPVLSPFVGDTGRRWVWLLEDRDRIDGLLEALATPASGAKEGGCNS